MNEQENLIQKTVIRFKDVIILNHLKNKPLLTGYEIVRYIHGKMDIIVSPGVIYAALYSLERQNLVEANGGQGKRLYRLTKKGESEILKMKDSIDSVLSSIFSEAMELTA